MNTMITRIGVITLIGLAGCTTGNDVALRQAQASIEQARQGQILAAGLAGSSNWTAAALFVLVITLCLVVLLITWSLINRRSQRPAAESTQIRTPKQIVQRAQVGNLPLALLSPAEQQLILLLRNQRHALPVSQAEQWWQNVEDEQIDPWGQG